MHRKLKNLKSNRDDIQKNRSKIQFKKIETQNEFNKFIKHYLNQSKNKNFQRDSINPRIFI